MTELRGFRRVSLFLVAAVSLTAQTPGTRGHSATMHQISPGYLGAGVLEVTPERAKALKLPEVAGVEIKYVDENTAASKAGLKTDDVILEINKEKVESLDQFVNTISLSAPGTKISMTVWREGTKRTIGATLEARRNGLLALPMLPLPQGYDIMPSPAPMIGIDGEPLTPQLAQYFGVEYGVLVRTVNPRTPAEKAGLKAGDVITKVNGIPVTSPHEVTSLLRPGRKPMVFTVVRNHKEITLNVELALEFDPWSYPGGREDEPNGLYLAFFRVP